MRTISNFLPYQTVYKDVLFRSRRATYAAFEKYLPDANKELHNLIFLLGSRDEREEYAQLIRVVNPNVAKRFPYVYGSLLEFLSKINMQNTVEKWFEKACLMSIGYAYKHPEKSTSEQLYPALIGLGSGYSPFKLEEGSFSFHSYYKWEPGRETKTSFIKSVTSLFEEQLLVYISTIERAAQAEKKAFAYLPRGLSDHDILDDAKRLVYYQILEQSFQTIAEALPKHAEEGGVTYQTVNRGVSRFAAFVGVPIRPSKKGGRPKTK